MPAFPYAGTVSEGTLRPQDLIPKFMDVLSDMLDDGAIVHDPTLHIPGLKCLHCRVQDDLGDLERDMDRFDYFDSDRCADDLDHLFNLLNMAAPAGFYFGAHPGDGSDFGFWPEDGDDCPCLIGRGEEEP